MCVCVHMYVIYIHMYTTWFYAYLSSGVCSSVSRSRYQDIDCPASFCLVPSWESGLLVPFKAVQTNLL